MSKSYKEIMDKIYVDDAMKQRILQKVEQEQKKQRILQNTEKEQKKQGIPQNTKQEQRKQGIPQNTDQKDSSTGNSRKQGMSHYFHYKKLSVCVAAAVLIFCLTSYFGVLTILQPGRIHQHNMASDNKKDSLSAADKKDENSNNISSDDANTEDELNAGEESDTGSISMDAIPEISQYSSAKELSQKIGFTISDIPSSLIPFKVSERTYYDCGDGLAEIQYYSDTAQSVVYRKQSVPNSDISGDYTEYSDVITVKVQSMDICLKGEKGKYNLATWSKGKYSYSLYLSDGITEKEFKNHYFLQPLD